MKNDAMLVELDMIAAARINVTQPGATAALAYLGKLEPVLAEYIAAELASVGRRMEGAHVPATVRQKWHTEALSCVLTCVEALRLAHFELWKDTLLGPRLAALMGETISPPRNEPGPGGPAERAGPR